MVDHRSLEHIILQILAEFLMLGTKYAAVVARKHKSTSLLIKVFDPFISAAYGRLHFFELYPSIINLAILDHF